MAEGKELQRPFAQETTALASALAEKGTPGIILLAIVLFVVWVVPVAVAIGLFVELPTPQQGTLGDYLYAGYYLAIMAILVGLLALISRHLTNGTLKSIVPTMRAEAETKTMRLMDQATGGGLYGAGRRREVPGLNKDTASTRIRKIMAMLIRRAASVLEVPESELRANIFVTADYRLLGIANGFHVNMANKKELAVKIPNGFLSSGTSFRYFRPVVSLAHQTEHGKVFWDHDPDEESLRKEYCGEVIQTYKASFEGVDQDLKWIVTFPIPYEAQPIKLVSAVLNLDGRGHQPYRDQLKSLLPDISVAAALIGLINHSTGVLGGKCFQPDPAPEHPSGIKTDGSLREAFMLDPDDFDPTVYPEPSEEFKNDLAKIQGLEFFKRITTADVAEYLRNQLSA